MKFSNKFSICFAILGCLSSLHGDNQVSHDPLLIQQQTEDTLAFLTLVDPWKKATEAYEQKNDINFCVTCKICKQETLSLGEFNGYLMAWLIKAVPVGHDAFEKIKKLVDEFIILLSNNASAETLTMFMLTTLNDMKQECVRCHGIAWEK